MTLDRLWGISQENKTAPQAKETYVLEVCRVQKPLWTHSIKRKTLRLVGNNGLTYFLKLHFYLFFITFLHKLSICDRYVNLKCSKKLYLEHTSAHEYTAMRPQNWFHHIVQTQSGFNLLFFSLSKIGKRRKSWSWITKVQYSFCNSIQTN